MAGVKGRSGRKPGTAHVTGFREWCRAVIERPGIRESIADAALENPEFALKVAEHGFGRPPQSLDITSGGAPIKFDLALRLVPGVGKDGN